MKQFVKLTELNKQDWIKFLGFKIKPKPTSSTTISIDVSKIATFGFVTPKKKNIYFRTDFPIVTFVEIVGGQTIHVIESPDEIERLINK